MTVEQGLRAEFHDRPKVLARALRAAKEQGRENEGWGSLNSNFTWIKTKEGHLYWLVISAGLPNPDQYLPDGYVDVEDEDPKSNLFTHLQEEQSNNANVLLADSISQNNAISFVEWIALSAWEYNGNTKTWYNYMECFFPTTKELMELYFEKYFR